MGEPEGRGWSAGASIRRVLVCTMLAGIGVPLIATFLVFLSAMQTLSTDNERNVSERVLGQMRNQLQYSVQVLVSSLEGQYGAAARNMSEEQIVALVRRELDPVRYGESGYIFGYTSDGVRMLAAENPAQVGKSLWDMTDRDGVKVIQELIRVAKAGGGFVSYVWKNPKTEQQEPKLSYATLLHLGTFELMVGTGSYLQALDHARAEAREQVAQIRSRLMRQAALVSGLITLVVLLVLHRLIRVTMLEPIAALVGLTERVAAGDLTSNIEVKSRNEIGQLMRALLGVTATLSSVVAELRIVIQASQEGRLGVRGDASQFEGAYAELIAGTNALLDNVVRPIRFVANNTDAIASSSEELTAVSQQLGSNANETSAQMLIVAAAAEQVSSTVQSLATSTDEMAVTIQEIAKNATDSARVAGQAVTVAETANGAVGKLGESATAIGKVIKVITAIAQQTNLLALNATIEAARAGEAGKGFAVVANEVKELAKETARATEDVARSVDSIQTDTREAVSAISAISGIITQINDIAHAIAGAVEEQSATTNEMRRNLGEAAKGSGDIARNITALTQVAQSTSNGASQTLDAANELARMAAELKQLIGTFTFSNSTAAPPALPRSSDPMPRENAPRLRALAS
jgi:methyl-accepting chemotaxis protein